MRKPVVATLVVAILGVSAVGAWLTARADEPPRFCKMGLAIGEVDGHGVSLQDQGDPGRDHCDIDEDGSAYDVVDGQDDKGGLTLGFDCAVRDRDGNVVATDEPNRPDGTCGQDEP